MRRITLEPSQYLNRELSWLEFNQRVLDEAADRDTPLLERVKFLSIVCTNLDEFFMIRVAGVKQQLAGEVVEPAPDGMTPPEQLAAISSRVHRMVKELYFLWRHEVHPALAQARIIVGGALSAELAAVMKKYFIDEVFPVLTPMVIDPGHPFPHLKNKSLNLGLVLATDDPEVQSFAVVPVPAISPRLVDGGTIAENRTWVLLEQIIARFAAMLFPGKTVLSVSPFRLTRNWDLEIDEEEAEDLLVTIQQELRKRERGNAVRLEVETSVDPRFESLLRQVLRLEPSDVYAVDGPLHLGDLMPIAGSDDRRELRDEPFTPKIAPAFRDVEDLFAVISDRDVLLQHPYDSFDSVVEFVSRAADDPRVLAIKLTLYRAGPSSPFVRALARAADNGKQVTALVELKARFDEAANIQWARALEDSGVHVVYGLIGLKTHCKVCLIVRREPRGLRRYMHFSTGNYNPSTARLYTDLSLFTARNDFGEDATALFNLLTGYCEPPEWKRLSVAPIGLRESVLRLVERETMHARAGRAARLIAKLNALVDPEVISALYSASRAGVKVDLIVRGICCLRPGVAGLSETITVVSIIDRFLEHSRVIYVDNGGDPEAFFSSADWMPRNFERRVEVLVPIEDLALRRWVGDVLLRTLLEDDVKARVMGADGVYGRRERGKTGDEVHGVRAQRRFIEQARGRARLSLPAPPAVFRARTDVREASGGRVSDKKSEKATRVKKIKR